MGMQIALLNVDTANTISVSVTRHSQLAEIIESVYVASRIQSIEFNFSLIEF